MCDVVQHTVPYTALVSLACDAGAVARPPHGQHQGEDKVAQKGQH